MVRVATRMSDSTITFVILGVAVVLFVSVLAVEIVAVGAALSLYATGVLASRSRSPASAIRPSFSSRPCSS